jgi:peptidylprolyl isomerase
MRKSLSRKFIMRLVVILLILAVAGWMLVGCGAQQSRAVQRYPDPVALPSGLVIQDFRYGDGVELVRGDVFTVRYTTYLDNGSEVESEDAYTFIGGVGTVMPGLDQGVSSMQVGGQRKLIIPPSLAYGSAGKPPNIPPNATLTMYVEVLSVAKKQTTENGVQYVDLVEGSGETPFTGDKLVVNYTGWLQSDGTMFDSSLNEGREPFEFAFDTRAVIPGWDEGTASMRTGGKRVLTIPPAMGYGDAGSGEAIPPGATLIFEVELLQIKPS